MSLPPATTVLEASRLTSVSNPCVRAEFEAALSEYHGVSYAISTGSGTAALHAVLTAIGVSPGDEVIVPTHTFIGSASGASHLGARLVFADVDAETFCVGPETVGPLVGPRTKAIVVVHLNGYPCDGDGIVSMAVASLIDLEISDFPPPETVHGLWQTVASAAVPTNRQARPRRLLHVHFVSGRPHIGHIRQQFDRMLLARDPAHALLLQVEMHVLRARKRCPDNCDRSRSLRASRP